MQKRKPYSSSSDNKITTNKKKLYNKLNKAQAFCTKNKQKA